LAQLLPLSVNRKKRTSKRVVDICCSLADTEQADHFSFLVCVCCAGFRKSRASFSNMSALGGFGPVHTLASTTTDCVSCVKFSPKECPMLLAGVAAWDGSCSIWQVARDASGGVISQPAWTSSHDGPLLSMSFSPDGRVFYGGCTKTAVMWDLNSDQKRVVASHDLPISCLDYVTLPQSMASVLLSGSWDGKVRWWDLRQQNFAMEQNLGEPVFALDAQKTVPMMAAATGRMVHIYNLQSSQKVSELKVPDVMKFNIRCVTCAPQYDGVGVGSSEGRVSFINMKEAPGCTFKAHIGTEKNQYILNQTNFCVHHPTKPLLFSGGGDGNITAINRGERKIIKTLQCEQKMNDLPISISAGDISGDGSLLAYAHSYDWAMGKSGYRNQPTSVHIRTIGF
jgi:mRNA export factor